MQSTAIAAALGLLVAAAPARAGEVPCLADLNGDGAVDVQDLGAAIVNWGPCSPACPPCAGDTNGDCDVDVPDLALIITSWGACPSAHSVFVGNPDGFANAVAAAGVDLLFSWSFLPDALEPGEQTPIDDWLNLETHDDHAPGVWTAGGSDLWPAVVASATFSANLAPGSPIEQRPADGLFYRSADGAALAVNTLTANYFSDAFDIVLAEPVFQNVQALAIEIINNPGFPLPPPRWHVTVFGISGFIIDETLIQGVPAGQPTFFGIAGGTVPIGRIEVWDEHNGAEGIASIRVYVP